MNFFESFISRGSGVSVSKPSSWLGPLIGVMALLAAANVGAWAWGLCAFQGNAVLLGTALLAYTLGLRHAVDADHIAAIDGVTRKLMANGQRPLAVGLLFALGHSTVVFGLSLGIASAARIFAADFDALKQAGGAIGGVISAVFLLAIALANGALFMGQAQAFRAARHGDLDVAGLEAALTRGLLPGRFAVRMNSLISRSWQMYPLGVLFGLGFDTATEIGLLGIAATQATQNLPPWSILVFPALFTAGMCLVDTLDGLLMAGVCQWASLRPVRKLYYNLTITLISALVAAGVGGIEGLGLLAPRLGWDGPVWTVVAAINDNSGMVGVVIIGVIAASWLVSVVLYRARGYDETGVLGRRGSA